MSRRKLLFLATEDWFFRSHFLPLVGAARDAGFEPILAARFGEAAAEIEAAGAALRPLPGLGRSLSPLSLMREATELRALMAREQPVLIHAFALKPCFLTALCASAAPQAKRVFAVTGLGYLGATRSPVLGGARETVLHVIAHAARSPGARIAVENQHDAARLARCGAPADHIAVLPGAGVDIDAFPPSQQPPAPPFRIGVAARLVRSKGVDVLVRAHQKLRARGLDVVLDIAGRADPANPAKHTEEEIEAWRALPGVRIHGWISDVAAFWRDAHIGVIPSLGGEGLPRALLEAAASGVPIVTTRTPGCEDFVRGGAAGLALPPGDVTALADALQMFIEDAPLRTRLGAAARDEIARAYTIAHVQKAVKEIWRSASAETQR